jgi:hypothetical protein
MGKGSVGTGSFGKFVANVPTTLQALRFKPGILVRLSGVDTGSVENVCRFVALTGPFAASAPNLGSWT